MAKGRARHSSGFSLFHLRGKAEDRCFYLRDFVEAVQRAVAGLYGVTYTTISFLQKPGTKHPSIIEEFIEEFVEENK